MASSSDDQSFATAIQQHQPCRGTCSLPGYKGKQCLLVTESRRFDAGIGGDAIQIEACRGSEQIASGTLGDESEGEVQTGYGMSPLKISGSRGFSLKGTGLSTAEVELAPQVTAESDLPAASAGAYVLPDRRHARPVQHRFDHGVTTHA